MSTPAAPAPEARRRRAPNPLPPGREYHRVLAGEKRRIGRGVLAIALLVAGLFGGIQIMYLLGTWIEGLAQGEGSSGESFAPISFAATLIATALLIPWSMLLQRWLYGMPAGSLHSVLSRFRFDLLGKSALAIAPLFLIALGINEYLEPRGTAAWSHSDLILFFVLAVLLVPLQAGAEEYAFRGFLARVAGSWVHGRWASLTLSIVVPGAVFSAIHFAGDPWWNVFYIVFSLATGLITWRTGGIEVAVVIHAAVNTITFGYWFVLHADLAERFDRSPGSVTPALFIPMVLVLVGITVVVMLRTRARGPATTPSAQPSADAHATQPATVPQPALTSEEESP